MFIRFFNIALITAYFFCGYAQITESRYIYTLKDIVYTQSKNNTPTRTHYFSATLLKHTHTFNQIEVGDHDNVIWINVKFNRLLISLYCVPSENDLLKIPLGSPQNKAPPIS